GGGVDGQPVLGGLQLDAVLHLIEGGEDSNHVLLAVPSDCIEMLEAETDRVDQAMASGARLVGEGDIQALAVGLGLYVSGRRQSGVHAGRRRRHYLTQKMLADEQPALGGRGVRRFAG